MPGKNVYSLFSSHLDIFVLKIKSMFKDKGNHKTHLKFRFSDHEVPLRYSDLFSCHIHMCMCCCF